MVQILTGLDKLIQNSEKYKKRNIGLIANQSSVTNNYKYSWQSLPSAGLQVKKIFSPEHGLFATEQDQIAVQIQPETGIPIISLYGQSYASLFPKESDLDGIDTIIFDIQDVGTRYYTYVNTLAYILKKISGKDIEILICDRPNPINGTHVEGPILKQGYHSFVGEIHTAVRHGLTAAELASFYIAQEKLDVQSTVFKIEGWQRNECFPLGQLPWIMPSPNMPDVEIALVYPGACLIEGTNLSEGRGTTRPFQHIGAPFIHPETFSQALNQLHLEPFIFRPLFFKPTFHKFKDEIIGGVYIHFDARKFCRPKNMSSSFALGVALMHTAFNLYPDNFQFLQNGYEFNTEHPAVDILSGDSHIREMILAGESFQDIVNSYHDEEIQYREQKEQFHIYG